MANQVVVSLLYPQSYRENKDADPIHYAAGLTAMPLEHAKEMGLLHRIRGVVDAEGQVQETRDLPFDGAFDEKLTAILEGAGYHTLHELKGASQDALRALEGIGPANYERIQAALR